jgi:hypothetical protein
MYYSVSVDHNGIAVISPEGIVKGIQKCGISDAVNKTDDICCGTALKRMGMLGVSVRKIKGTMKMEISDTDL